MATYVVMEPPADFVADAAEKAVFIRDGFAFIAFLVPPLWLLWHRLWLEALLAMAVAFGISVLGQAQGLGASAPFLSLIVSIFVGLEGQALRVARLRRAGWTDWGVIDADRLDDAEAHYYIHAAGDEPAEPSPATVRIVPAALRPPAALPALGLLQYPGRN